MKQLYHNPYTAHQDISLLLPWYVNKTLHGAETRSVEDHLKVCLSCRRELATLHKLSVAVRQEGSMDSAALASFSQLKKRIHGADQTSLENTPKNIILQSLWGKRSKLYLPQPALALAAVLLLSLLIPRLTDTGDLSMNDYRTLSNAENPAVSHNAIKVIFSNDAKQPQINALLASVHGRILDGPTVQGLYTITLDGKPATTNVLAMVESLRKNTHVIFAEPEYALLSSAHTDKDIK